MVRPWIRLAVALGALLMLVSGIISVTLSGRGTPAQAAGTYTIDILAVTFNPDVCTVNRNDSTVFFRNKDTKPRRVIWQFDHASRPPPEPRLDTGVIQPGETSASGWSVSLQVDILYEDFDNPQLTGRIVAPISNSAASDCTPRPPTPTPTNTPTITPTPAPTPIPQKPGRCIGLQGCGLAPDVRKDENP